MSLLNKDVFAYNKKLIHYSSINNSEDSSNKVYCTYSVLNIGI
jgi:hypothetical protein